MTMAELEDPEYVLVNIEDLWYFESEKTRALFEIG